jgi:hypothetical protein
VEEGGNSAPLGRVDFALVIGIAITVAVVSSSITYSSSLTYQMSRSHSRPRVTSLGFLIQQFGIDDDAGRSLELATMQLSLSGREMDFR